MLLGAQRSLTFHHTDPNGENKQHHDISSPVDRSPRSRWQLFNGSALTCPCTSFAGYVCSCIRAQSHLAYNMGTRASLSFSVNMAPVALVGMGRITNT